MFLVMGMKWIEEKADNYYYYATGFPFDLPAEDGDGTAEENWLHRGMVSHRCLFFIMMMVSKRCLVFIMMIVSHRCSLIFLTSSSAEDFIAYYSELS